MKSGRIISFLILVIFLVGLVACSATPTRRAFKETWRDSVVSTKVKYKLTSDKLVKKRNINVDVWRGVVTLTGRVTSPEEKERAEQLSWLINGVRGVDNFLKMPEGYINPSNEQVAKEDVTKEEKTTVAKKGPAVKKDKAVDKKIITEDDIAMEEVVTKETKKTASTKVPNDITVTKKTEVKAEEKVIAKPDKTFAERSRYSKPDSSVIKEEDLTTEESLAKEAAEELKKLKEEDTGSSEE